MLFPINLFLTYPVWSSSISWGKSSINLLAKAFAEILWSTFSNDIGLQFFKNKRSLYPFGNNDIIALLCAMDYVPYSSE